MAVPALGGGALRIAGSYGQPCVKCNVKPHSRKSTRRCKTEGFTGSLPNGTKECTTTWDTWDWCHTFEAEGPCPPSGSSPPVTTCGDCNPTSGGFAPWSGGNP